MFELQLLAVAFTASWYERQNSPAFFQEKFLGDHVIARLGNALLSAVRARFADIFLSSHLSSRLAKAAMPLARQVLFRDFAGRD
jgi:hypothetical protein